MKKTIIIAGFIGLLAATPALAQEKGGLIPWKYDPQKAIEEAETRGLGMMLYFTSEG